LGVSPAHVSDLTRGKTVPSEALIKSICSRFHTNEHWLKTGEGEMLEERTVVEYDVTGVLGREAQFLITRLIDILQSNDDTIKSAITANIHAFHNAISARRELAQAQEEAAKKDAVLDKMVRDLETLKKIIRPRDGDGSEAKEG